MHCPFCRHPDSRVVDSREADEGQAIRRRRSCPECGRRFTTVETAVLAVVKRSGVTEPFSREKVIKGVRRACQGRQVDDDALNLLAQQVEDAVRAAGRPRCPATRSGWRSWGRYAISTRSPICDSRRCTGRSRRPTTSNARSRRCARIAGCHPDRADRRRSVDLLTPSSTTRPATFTQPSGSTCVRMLRPLALGDRQVATEVVGDAHGRGAGRLVLENAEARRRTSATGARRRLGRSTPTRSARRRRG